MAAGKQAQPNKRGGDFRKLRILIAMQLKSKLDVSFLRSKRAFILKAGLALVLFAVITAAFYGVFAVSSMLSIFSYGGGIPDTVVTLLFTLIQLMSIWSCTVGLSKSLYSGGDNIILLVLPVPQNLVFLSKLAVYYVSELKRNLTLTVPLMLAYGIVSGAVWFYYPWMLFCFLFVSLVPVAIGAILSIPALYIPKLVSRFRAVKYAVVALAAAGLVGLAFWLVSLIPVNINILGHWGSISQGINNFLSTFARIFAPWHYLNRMMLGSTLEITRNPVTVVSIITFVVNLAVCAALLAASFFTARLLFLKMTARAGENEVRIRKNRPNKVRAKWWSMISEDLLRSTRSGKAVWKTFVEFFVPAFLIFALNRIYAAMNTSLTGQTMTAAFNVLVLLVTVLASNAYLANVYSRDGAARNLLKTRPVDFRRLLVSRLVLRAVMSTLSILAAVLIFHFVLNADPVRTTGFLFTAVFLNLAHIFWCAEIDVMNPEGKEGVGNGAKATVFAILISVLAAGGFYLLAGSGASSAFVKLAIIAFAFLALRTYLYFARVKVYFIEK